MRELINDFTNSPDFYGAMRTPRIKNLLPPLSTQEGKHLFACQLSAQELFTASNFFSSQALPYLLTSYLVGPSDDVMKHFTAEMAERSTGNSFRWFLAILEDHLPPLYRVGAFHDGIHVLVADLLYPTRPTPSPTFIYGPPQVSESYTTDLNRFGLSLATYSTPESLEEEYLTAAFGTQEAGSLLLKALTNEPEQSKALGKYLELAFCYSINSIKRAALDEGREEAWIRETLLPAYKTALSKLKDPSNINPQVQEILKDIIKHFLNGNDRILYDMFIGWTRAFIRRRGLDVASTS